MKQHHWLAVAAACIGTCHAAAFSAPPETEEAVIRDIGDVLAPLPGKYNVPGIAAVVIRGETVIAQGAAGIRARGHEEAVTVNDRWHLGSCTKAMTATMLATFVADGALQWDTTIGERLGAIEPMDAGWKGVTVRQLLAHRAGVPSDLNFDGLWGKLWDMEGDTTAMREALVRGILKHPPVHEPGTEFLYANAGFSIAAFMVERSSGKTWEMLMKERLFEPLGMTSAGFGAPGKPGVIDEPRGHDGSDVAQEPGPKHAADNPAAIGPGGTVHMSLADWGKFVGLHLAGERGTPRILSSAAIKQLHEPFPAKDNHRYGWGWGMTEREWAGGRVLTHSGSNTLWFAVVWAAPQKNMAILVACNQGGDDGAKACDEAAGKLAGSWVGPEGVVGAP